MRTDLFCKQTSLNLIIFNKNKSNFKGEKRYFHPVGGFQYKHIKIAVSAGKKANIEIKIKKD